MREAEGFVAGLGDTSFRSFATARIVGPLYTLTLVGIVLYGLLALYAALASGSAGFFFAMLVGVPLGGLLIAAYFRMMFEGALLLFRMAGTLQRLDDRVYDLGVLAAGLGADVAPSDGPQPSDSGQRRPASVPTATSAKTVGDASDQLRLEGGAILRFLDEAHGRATMKSLMRASRRDREAVAAAMERLVSAGMVEEQPPGGVYAITGRGRAEVGPA